MMLFHHWPLDRATGLAPAISSLGTKRVAGYTTPGNRIFLERPTGLAPVSREWKTRTLLLSYGRMEIEKGWTPRCSPPMGSTPVSLCSGPIVKGELGQHVPRYSSEARVIPMASGQGQIKNPALVSEGGVGVSFEDYLVMDSLRSRTEGIRGQTESVPGGRRCACPLRRARSTPMQDLLRLNSESNRAAEERFTGKRRGIQNRCEIRQVLTTSADRRTTPPRIVGLPPAEGSGSGRPRGRQTSGTPRSFA